MRLHILVSSLHLSKSHIVGNHMSQLKFLCHEADELFVDGTFKTCPKFYYQMYSVYGQNRFFMPLPCYPCPSVCTYIRLSPLFIKIHHLKQCPLSKSNSFEQNFMKLGQIVEYHKLMSSSSIMVHTAPCF